MSSPTSSAPIAMPRWRQYWVLTKPRVTQLAVFCAVIGMFLATPGMVPYPVLIGGIVGIWLLAGAAFAMNCSAAIAACVSLLIRVSLFIVQFCIGLISILSSRRLLFLTLGLVIASASKCRRHWSTRATAAPES